MAKAAPVRDVSQGSNSMHVAWQNLSASDPGEAVKAPSSNDKTVQFSGDFDGATATLQGSIDGVNFFNLSDAEGVVISTTGPLLTEVLENCVFYQVAVSGGTAPSITVHLLGRG